MWLGSKLEKYAFNENSELTYVRPGALERLGLAAGMLSALPIYWSVYQPRNFGDWVTPYIFHMITGQRLIYRETSNVCRTIFGAGSIVRKIKRDGSAIVWGSGAMSLKDSFGRPHRVCAVRGPLTRDIFLSRGVSCPDVFGDPAIILPRVYRPVSVRASERIAIIPHFREMEFFANIILPEMFRLIDVTQPIERVIDSISECECAVSSSLHGIIVSHAYGLPCTWVSFSRETERRIDGDGTKFRDYLASIGMNSCVDSIYLDPERMPGPQELCDIAKVNFVPDMTLLQDGLIEVCPVPIKENLHKIEVGNRSGADVISPIGVA